MGDPNTSLSTDKSSSAKSFANALKLFLCSHADSDNSGSSTEFPI